MNNMFNILLGSQPRFTGRNVIPSSIQNRQLGSDLVKNTAIEQSLFSGMPTGSVLTVTSTVTASANENIPVGVLPFCIVFFEGDNLLTANMIPSGSNLATNDYRIETVYMPPSLSPVGGNGSEQVIKTSLTNNTGSSQDITIVTQGRIILGVGGGA